jgi:hypothetical protein
MQAVSNLVENRSALVKLGKVLTLSLQDYVEAGAAEVAHDEIMDMATSMGDTAWSVDYRLDGFSAQKTYAKLIGTGLSVQIEGTVTLKVIDASPPERDYDYYDDGPY